MEVSCIRDVGMFNVLQIMEAYDAEGSLGYGEINLYINSWIGSWWQWWQSPLPATICWLVALKVLVLKIKFLNDGNLKALKIPILYLINGDEFFLQGWRG